jgi:hypothetical protein
LKSGAKLLLRKVEQKGFGSTLPLFKKVVQKFWLNLTTFEKSRAKVLAQPFLKVDFPKVDES